MPSLPASSSATIRTRIHETTGLTASVGIGPNRLIAKLSSEACKPDGLKVVRADEVLDFLAPLPLRNLRGMGPQTLKKIAALNIRTIGELRAVPQPILETQLGKSAAAGFLRQAQGIASSEITTARQRKSISKETTFSQDVTDTTRLHDVLRELAAIDKLTDKYGANRCSG
jgi:DNA polymerase-4